MPSGLLYFTFNSYQQNQQTAESKITQAMKSVAAELHRLAPTVAVVDVIFMGRLRSRYQSATFFATSKVVATSPPIVVLDGAPMAGCFREIFFFVLV